MKNLFAFQCSSEILRFAQNDMKSAIYDRAKYTSPFTKFKGCRVFSFRSGAYTNVVLTVKEEVDFDVE